MLSINRLNAKLRRWHLLCLTLWLVEIIWREMCNPVYSKFSLCAFAQWYLISQRSSDLRTHQTRRWT